MLEKFTRSYQLVKESFEVLKKDKEIMLFPVISVIVTILLLLSFIIPIFFLTFKNAPGIVSASLDGIFVTALYNYANTGKIPSAYSPEVIRDAFQPKNPHGDI